MLDPRVEAEGGPQPEPDEDDQPDLTQRPSERLRRDADLLGRRNSPVREWLRKKMDDIATGFEKQAARSDKLEAWWNIVHCHLDDSQYYDGTAQIYVPAIHDAIEARATRFANQLFPQSGKYVDCTASDGQQPYEILALINHYVRGTDSEIPLKQHIVKPLFFCGDVEGQMNLCVDWDVIERMVVSRETRGETMEGGPLGIDGGGEEITDIVEDEIAVGFPGLEILHDADVLVLPASSDSVLQALQNGGSATMVRRWTRERAEKMADDGLIAAEMADEDAVKPTAGHASGMVDLPKALAKAVGVKAGEAWMTGFETWLMVPLSDKGEFKKDGKRRLCRLYWNLMREPMGLRRNPFWNDRCPLLSIPRTKVPGVFKGASAVEPLAPIQYEINDAANERADVDHKAAMPIIRRTAQAQGNRPLIIAPGAVWDGGPGEIEFLEFPDLSGRAKARIVDGIQVIFQSLSVNPAMLPQQSGRSGQKRNQAEVAQEASVDLLTTAEAVSGMEYLLNEVVRWMVDLDHQFRDRDLTVKAWGKMGIQANMIPIPPIQNSTHYQFQWCGAEQARMNAAMFQQGTAIINVARGMAQDIQKEGLQLKLSPLLERAFSNIFGPELASQTLVDMRHQMTVEPEMENELLEAGHAVPTSPFDDLMQHIQSHSQAMQTRGDPTGNLKIHLQMHLLKLAEINQAQMAQMAGAGAQGVPGGAGPGVAGAPGSPQPGAVPAGPRLIKSPNGTIPIDQLPRGGAPVPPRRA